MRVWALSKKGFERIAKMQDTYKFRTQYAIDNSDSVQEFAEALLRCFDEGLDFEEDDRLWLEEVRDKIGYEVDADSDFVIEEEE